MPKDNPEEGVAAEVEREDHREESNGSTQDRFFRTKASYTMSPTFQDIRVTEMLAFRG
jgi:hypothetical protein